MSAPSRPGAWLSVLLLAACAGTTSTTESTSSTSGGSSSGGSESTSGGSATGGSNASTGTSSGSNTTGSTGSSSGSGSTTSGFQTAAHHPLPQVPRNNGPILFAPEVVTISYAGYPYDVNGYFQELVQSSWLTTVGADYGIGLGTVTASVVLDGGPGGAPAAVTDDDIVALLTQLIMDGGVPPLDLNTLYVVVYPEATVVSDSQGTSCNNFGAYHNRFSLGESWVPYGVIPTCAGYPGSEITTEVWVDEAYAHEFIETATDPVRTPAVAGYHLLDPKDPWTYAGGEVADLCTMSPPYFAADGGVTAARSWSNSAAALGTSSPCVPAPAGETYFNVSVDPATTVIVDGGSSRAQTISFTLTGWSTAATGDWTVLAQAGSSTIDPSLLDVRLNGIANTINLNNGQTATMTITIPAGTPGGNYASVALYSYTSPNHIDYFGSYSMAAVTVR